jgi:hypothetical protein
MVTYHRYPSTPVGELLGRFYTHRSTLRRTIPLLPISLKDIGRMLKGNGMSLCTSEPAPLEATASGKTAAKRHSSHRRPAHA